jgi:hypothetical protein
MKVDERQILCCVAQSGRGKIIIRYLWVISNYCSVTIIVTKKLCNCKSSFTDLLLSYIYIGKVYCKKSSWKCWWHQHTTVTTVLAQATLGDETQNRTNLLVCQHLRWPRQVCQAFSWHKTDHFANILCQCIWDFSRDASDCTYLGSLGITTKLRS